MVIPEKIIFAVYGTLKRKYGNHVLLSKDSVKYLGDFVTKPEYTMISLGGFPAVFEHGKTSIHIELYETSDPDVIQRVYRLEGYTGIRNNPNNWYDTIPLETPYGEATMFVFKNKNNFDFKHKTIVENGNW